MTADHKPELVSPALLALTRSLGERDRDLVILAEGNTSQLLDDGRLVVKASGARMRDVSADDFVVVDLPPLVDLITSPTATQDDLTAALDAGTINGRRRRGSIETLVHVAVQAVKPAAYVGHTHPTAVIGLLASVCAETAFDYAAYSDEAVVIGRPLFVPYAQPGIDLGKAFFQRLEQYADRHGDLPQLVTLGNHGIVAIAPTAEGIEAISESLIADSSVPGRSPGRSSSRPCARSSTTELSPSSRSPRRLSIPPCLRRCRSGAICGSTAWNLPQERVPSSERPTGLENPRAVEWRRSVATLNDEDTQREDCYDRASLYGHRARIRFRA
jgi:ribulose-5-phosphate 4-epimerase/fuculose-1-phosphate aldolase